MEYTNYKVKVEIKGLPYSLLYEWYLEFIRDGVPSKVVSAKEVLTHTGLLIVAHTSDTTPIYYLAVYK